MRYAFDHSKCRYDLIYKERIKKGNLRADYDVILIPSQGRAGEGPGRSTSKPRPKPCAYTKSRRFPSLGAYGEFGRHHRRHGPGGRRRAATNSSDRAAC